MNPISPNLWSGIIDVTVAGLLITEPSALATITAYGQCPDFESPYSTTKTTKKYLVTLGVLGG
ncbi:MAG TPA: hypothetical protein VLU94_02840 [Candidatus Nitrosotalea sp.]|nr:hypothetical protein [Candidatus Nitrosotalea sp.]